MRRGKVIEFVFDVELLLVLRRRRLRLLDKRYMVLDSKLKEHKNRMEYLLNLIAPFEKFNCRCFCRVECVKQYGAQMC